MINVTKTYLPTIDEYNSYIKKAFSSGWVTNNGELVQTLENKLKEYLNVKNIVLVSNGTLALQIAYKVLNLTGDIITTPFSFVATTSSLVWEGLNPIFVDIDKKSLNMDYTKIEKAITERTTAILPVHVFGNGCRVDEIAHIAKKHHLQVIYDAAHAFGVNYKNNSILNYGSISILSFHATKIFHTIEGGALIINDDELYKKAKKMINFGIVGPDQIECLGINAKMNEFQAAMGLCLLDHIDEIMNNRRQVYDYYTNHLSKLTNINLQKHNENSTLSYSYFPVVFESEEKLLLVKNSLQNEKIMPRRYFYPSLNTLCYLKPNQLTPISEDISKRILCLPMYDSLDRTTQEKIIKIIKESLEQNSLREL